MYQCTTAKYTRTNVLRCIQRGCSPVPMYSVAFNGGECLKSRRGPLTSGNRIKCPHVRCTQRRPTPHCVKSTSYHGRQCGTPVPMYSVAVNGGAFNVSCANALCPYQCTPLQSTGVHSMFHVPMHSARTKVLRCNQRGRTFP